MQTKAINKIYSFFPSFLPFPIRAWDWVPGTESKGIENFPGGDVIYIFSYKSSICIFTCIPQFGSDL